jgi:hypothetical protein
MCRRLPPSITTSLSGEVPRWYDTSDLTDYAKHLVSKVEKVKKKERYPGHRGILKPPTTLIILGDMHIYGSHTFFIKLM